MRTTVIAKQDQESQNLGRLNNLRCNLSVRMTRLECCHGNKTSTVCYVADHLHVQFRGPLPYKNLHKPTTENFNI